MTRDSVARIRCLNRPRGHPNFKWKVIFSLETRPDAICAWSDSSLQLPPIQHLWITGERNFFNSHTCASSNLNDFELTTGVLAVATCQFCWSLLVLSRRPAPTGVYVSVVPVVITHVCSQSLVPFCWRAPMGGASCPQSPYVHLYVHTI